MDSAIRGVNIDRPPLLPVMGAQLAPAHSAARYLLNAHALLGGHVAVILMVSVQKPLPDGHLGYVQLSRQRTLAATNLYGATQGRKVGGFHGQR